MILKYLHCAGGIQMYFLKNGWFFARFLAAFAIGLLNCFKKSTPNLKIGNAPIAMAF